MAFTSVDFPSKFCEDQLANIPQRRGRRRRTSDVTDCADVLGSLAGNDLGRQGREFREIQSVRVRLLGELWTLRGGSRLGLLHSRLEGLLALVEGLLVIEVLGGVGVEHRGSGLRLVGEVTVGRHIGRKISREPRPSESKGRDRDRR